MDEQPSDEPRATPLSEPEHSRKTRKLWVEPTVRKIDIGETAFHPGTGLDGDPRFADCTKS